MSEARKIIWPTTESPAVSLGTPCSIDTVLHGSSDIFGATGDPAYKNISPSLQAMLERGHLDVPVVGVAKSA